VIVAPANIEFPSPLRREGRIVLPEGSLQVRFDRDGLYARQVSDDVHAEQDQSRGAKRETFCLAGLLHFAGATVGFLIGGPAGAALGLVVAARVGATATQQNNIVFKRVLKWRAFAARHSNSHHVQAGEAVDGTPHNLRR
jgi:hypothetical protein